VHPILSNRVRLAVYLAAWVPVGVLLTLGLVGDSTWTTAGALFLPLSLVYGFIGLSIWYVCRALPLDPGRTTRAVAALVIGAAIASAAWVAIGQAYAAALDSLVAGLDAGVLLNEQRQLLFVVGTLLFWLVATVYYLLIAFQASRVAETRALELSLLAREAELRALRAQIDPHFLFNSLNSISALTSTDPTAARRMCVLLADFLRSTIRLGSTSRIPLGEELDLAERFLAIERVRLGSRLSVTRDADQASAVCLVPPLLLQPLIENAVIHGIGHLLEGGNIRMAASRGGTSLTISLENPCDPGRPRRSGTGVGLDLLRRRVATHFGAEGAVRVDERPESFRVEVTIPAVTAA
jgi:hypothetical protein